MRRRSGSAESVVFPVPDRPKKIAARPSPPTFAEQCIERTPSSGRRSFITAKMDLDLARVERAADQNLATRRWRRMNALLRAPSSLGSASTDGA